MPITRRQICFLIIWSLIAFLVSGIIQGGFYTKLVDEQRIMALYDKLIGEDSPTPTKPIACQSITASALSKVKTTKYGIPLIMHQIYKDNMVPVQYIRLLRGCRWVNPEFLHLLWTDDLINQFLNTFYPQYKSIFAKYGEAVQKADYFRALLLYHFGGVYIDMDVECKKPLSVELDQFKSSAILDQEMKVQTRLRWDRDHTAMNSAMMARKGHPFFKYLMDKFPVGLKKHHVMWRTGPFFLDDRYEEYQRQKQLQPEDRVCLAPPTAFSPYIDPSLYHIFRWKCIGYRYKRKIKNVTLLGCYEWVHKLKRKQNDTAIDQAIMVHRFLHLVYDSNRHAIRKRVDICKEVPNTLRFKL